MKVRAEDSLYEKWCANKEDAETFNSLIAHMRRHARAVCFLVLHNPRSDVVDRAVAKAIASLPTFKGNSKFSTWFHTIVLSFCVSSLRGKEGRQAKEVALEENMATFNPYEEVDARLDMDKRLQGLPADDREFLMERSQYKTSADFARATSQTPEAVRVRLHRIRAKLTAHEEAGSECHVRCLGD